MLGKRSNNRGLNGNGSMKRKVVHITIVHRRYDSRIFYKECVSLARVGYEVSFIVADGLGDEENSGVKIIDIGRAESSRLKRMIKTSRKAVKAAASLKADIYHFHDPDLLIAALGLRKSACVVFDSHEDFPALMLQRDYIPDIARRLLFRFASFTERYSAKRLSGVVCATETIRKKFLSYGNVPTETVRNYPVFADNGNDKPHCFPKKAVVCYVGGLTEVRGVKEMVEACDKAGVKLLLAGEFDDMDFFNGVKAMPQWQNVEFLGYVPNAEVRERVYERSSVGLVLLHEAPNHTYSIPIKQLEYMQAGLPVIASREVLFCNEVTEKEHCGLVVNPLDIDEVAEAIRKIVNNPDLAKQMSANAVKASADKYNWSSQEKVLLDFYKRLLV